MILRIRINLHQSPLTFGPVPDFRFPTPVEPLDLRDVSPNEPQPQAPKESSPPKYSSMFKMGLFFSVSYAVSRQCHSLLSNVASCDSKLATVSTVPLMELKSNFASPSREHSSQQVMRPRVSSDFVFLLHCRLLCTISTFLN